MIALEDLDPDLRSLLARFDRHPKISVALGAKQVILYCLGRQTEKQVEQHIPEEYREQIQVVLTRKIRPAYEPTTKASKEPRPTGSGGRGSRRS